MRERGIGLCPQIKATVKFVRFNRVVRANLCELEVHQPGVGYATYRFLGHRVIISGGDCLWNGASGNRNKYIYLTSHGCNVTWKYLVVSQRYIDGFINTNL